MPRIAAVALVMTLLSAGAGGPASAEPSAVADVRDPDRKIEQRIGFIEDRLDSRRQHAQIWYWGWLTVYSASTVGLGIEAANADKRTDHANYVSQAVLAAVGVGDLLLFRPLDARFGADPIRALPETTPAERQEKLDSAEARLRANAARAATRTSWPLHLANAAANVAAGLVVWAAGDGKAGAVSALIGTLGGEAYIWTPTTNSSALASRRVRSAAGESCRRLAASRFSSGSDGTRRGLQIVRSILRIGMRQWINSRASGVWKR